MSRKRAPVAPPVERERPFISSVIHIEYEWMLIMWCCKCGLNVTPELKRKELGGPYFGECQSCHEPIEVHVKERAAAAS